jgi:hypothetical protein
MSILWRRCQIDKNFHLKYRPQTGKFLYKNNDVTKQKIDIGLAFVCAYKKFLMRLMPHLFFSFCKIFVFIPWDIYVPTVRNRMRLYIRLHNTHIDTH